MCSFAGFVDFQKNLQESKDILMNMNNALLKNKQNKDDFYIKDHVALASSDLIANSLKNGATSCIETFFHGDYALIFNGQIYNKEELKKDLEEESFSFISNRDTEILLKAFIHYGYDVVSKLNGAFSFAIWNEKKQELFLARDHFGIKPFFYTIQDKELIMSSEIKALFAHPKVERILDSQSICELLGLGPVHTPGTTVFKDIYELKPAHYAVFNESGLHINRYWKLESNPHTDDFDTTCQTVKNLLEDSIKRQLVSDLPICTFLSGGLDSSIISKYASDYLEDKNMGPLNTFSVDYVDNDKNFVKSDFQPNSDNYYIDLMKNSIGSNHHNIILDTPELADALEDAMIARDMPGMADVDSSLLLFCKNVKPNAAVTLTGECADEIFGGYPWFFREDALKSNTFPWSIALEERQYLLNPSLSNKINLREYVDYRYLESLSEVTILDCDSKETSEKRKISHLTLNWFMQTLLDRSDRMAMYNGFEIRVPFCDHRLAQYVWNIPWEMKALNGREKGLLRHVMEGILPEEIIYRKKSPYPKTHNPNYLKKVKGMLTNILNQKNAPICELLNKQYIEEILRTDGRAFSRPWFGQLMTGPQLMAYLCQVNMWLEKYQPKIEI